MPPDITLPIAKIKKAGLIIQIILLLVIIITKDELFIFGILFDLRFSEKRRKTE